MVELDDTDARILGHFLDGARRSDTDVDQGDLPIECVQYGTRSADDGVAVTVEGRQCSLCCPSSESMFREEYESLRTAADAE